MTKSYLIYILLQIYPRHTFGQERLSMLMHYVKELTFTLIVQWLPIHRCFEQNGDITLVLLIIYISSNIRCISFYYHFTVKITFLQNHLLLHNISQGIIISNHSLVLQGVTRSTAGNYSCVGFNAEGEGISEPFVLNILCKSFIY